MKDVIEQFISPKWLGVLFKSILEIRDERSRDISKIGDVFGDPKELAQFYVEPECQHVNPANEDEDDPISIVRSSVSFTINNFLNGEFAIHGDGRSQLFVLSDAGMGKTSLLMMLRLSHLTGFWPKSYNCELLKISPRTIFEIGNIENKSNTVLLLDALDEDPSAWGNYRERVLALLTATKNFRRVIISCRTQFFPNDEIDPFKRVGKIKVGGFVCPMIFLSLFSDKQVLEYLEKRFPSSSYNKEVAYRVIHRMGSLRFRPLLLAHIDGFIESTETLWSEFKVFRTLVDTWLMREEVKIYEQGRTATKEDLLKACIIIAIEMQREGERILHNETLQLLSENNPEISHLDHMEIGGRSLLNKNCEGDYRFSHYTIQEYLIAFAIINNLLSTAQSPIRSSSKILSFVFSERRDNNALAFLDYTGAIVNNKDFGSANLKGSSFTRANLDNSSFKNADLENANFEEASLKGANLSGCNLRNANLIGADLSGVDLRHTDLKGAILRGANLTKAVLNYNNLDNAILMEANLTNASLVGIKLRKANLSNSILVASNFTRANLMGAKLSGADCTETNFQRCPVHFSA